MILNIVQRIINFVLPLPIFYSFSACREGRAHLVRTLAHRRDGLKGQRAEGYAHCRVLAHTPIAKPAPCPAPACLKGSKAVRPCALPCSAAHAHRRALP